MPPRPYHKRHSVVILVLGFQGTVSSGGSVAVFLVPLTDNQHRRDGVRSSGEPFIDGLKRPKIRVRRVFHELPNSRNMFSTYRLHELRDRSSFEKTRIFVACSEGEVPAAFAFVK